MAGEPGDAPSLFAAPYDVANGAVDDYLATLRGLGYFTDRCLVILCTYASATAHALRHQPPTGSMPHLKDIPIFAQNFDDMVSQKGYFIFTTEHNRRYSYMMATI